MMKKQKQRSENGARKTDRTSIILSMFREFPNNKFSLKHLASASVICKRLQLFALMTGQQAGQVQISGDATVLKRLLAYASKFEKTFNVIEP